MTESTQEANKVMKRFVQYQKEKMPLFLDWKEYTSFGEGFSEAEKYKSNRIWLYDVTESEKGYDHSNQASLLSKLVQTEAIPLLLTKRILNVNAEFCKEQMEMLLPDFVSGYVHHSQYYYGTQGIYLADYGGRCHKLEFQAADETLQNDRFFYRLVKVARNDNELREFLEQNKGTGKLAYNEMNTERLILRTCSATPGLNDSYSAIMRDVIKARCG